MLNVQEINIRYMMLKTSWIDNSKWHPATHPDWVMTPHVTTKKHAAPRHAWLECRTKLSTEFGWNGGVQMLTNARLHGSTCSFLFYRTIQPSVGLRAFIHTEFLSIILFRIPNLHDRGPPAPLRRPWCHPSIKMLGRVSFAVIYK